MRKSGLFAAVLILFLFPGLPALELRMEGGMDNLAFDRGRTSALGAGAYDANPLFTGSAELSGDFAGYFRFNAGYERDPLLRNLVKAYVGMRQGYFNLELGPFIGVFNSGKGAPNPGLSFRAGLEYPGRVFLTLGGASTLGTGLSTAGDKALQWGEVILGFYVPYVTCSLLMNTRNYKEMENPGLVLKDERTRYGFRAEVVSKSYPYVLQVDAGFQTLKRSYAGELFEPAPPSFTRTFDTDEIRSIYLGLGVNYQVARQWRIFLGGEMPVYTWGTSPLKKEKGAVFFQLSGGFIWTVPSDL
ncbi:MAG: hypothetical protein LBL43_05555 [Treponema sp.]|jgi:hypothetical protein|nr:hypothetical protein [Treponema sp.]